LEYDWEPTIATHPFIPESMAFVRKRESFLEHNRNKFRRPVRLGDVPEPKIGHAVW